MPAPAREIDVEVLPEEVRPGARGDDKPAALLAHVMDSLFTVPGTKIRFGLDSLVSLIPGAGSSLSTFLSLLILGRGAQRGVPHFVLGRMGWNILLNALLDAIPVLGGPLTAFYRSNARNHALLQKHAGTRRPATLRDKLFVAALILGLILLVVALIVGAVVLAQKFWSLLTA